MFDLLLLICVILCVILVLFIVYYLVVLSDYETAHLSSVALCQSVNKWVNVERAMQFTRSVLFALDRRPWLFLLNLPVSAFHIYYLRQKKPYLDPTTVSYYFHQENRTQGIKAAFYALSFVIELFLFVYAAVTK
eukprot:TRINITY_DN82_c3_g1_i1.p1 TRINITY_DN82_c3_g1~~TRINITY_DN82_c3_g1_i1.p1  ORF type:complete len:134 (-),score=8.77 TRINITY_DN82_c3_g1_i1:478-879(-)